MSLNKEAEASQEMSSLLIHPEDDIVQRVDLIRSKLKELNTLYQGLVVAHGVTADWYVGSGKTYTYLPDTVMFSKTHRTRY